MRAFRSPRTQTAVGFFGDTLRELVLPGPDEESMPGLRWGEPAEIFSPAFWAHQVWLFDLGTAPRYRVGETLIEEVAVCLLGGFGFRSEVGWAAFTALKNEGLLALGTSQSQIERVLRDRLMVQGRQVHYRFPKQKSLYLAAFLKSIETNRPPTTANGAILRDWLLQFRGIGAKTAAWVARNWLNSDDVAIIDIHVYRAGLLTGFFEADLTVERHYAALERCFIQFAEAINVRPSDLDAVIWEQMRNFGDYPIRMLKTVLTRSANMRQ